MIRDTSVRRLTAARISASRRSISFRSSAISASLVGREVSDAPVEVLMLISSPRVRTWIVPVAWVVTDPGLLTKNGPGSALWTAGCGIVTPRVSRLRRDSKIAGRDYGGP